MTTAARRTCGLEYYGSVSWRLGQTFTWTPSLASSGIYRVYARSISASNFAPDAPYTIHPQRIYQISAELKDRFAARRVMESKMKKLLLWGGVGLAFILSLVFAWWAIQTAWIASFPERQWDDTSINFWLQLGVGAAFLVAGLVLVRAALELQASKQFQGKNSGRKKQGHQVNEKK